MKQLSLTKVNELRSGHTLFWVEARIGPHMKVEVEVKEKLLQGKKYLLPMSGLLYADHGPAAGFASRKGSPFVVPTGVEMVERWFFANRRSAQQAAAELRAGIHPQPILGLIEEARWHAKKREEERQAQLAREQWDRDHPGQRGLPIRAFGETEDTLGYRMWQAFWYAAREEAMGRPFPQARRYLRFRHDQAMEERNRMFSDRVISSRVLEALGGAESALDENADFSQQPKNLTQKITDKGWSFNYSSIVPKGKE